MSADIPGAGWTGFSRLNPGEYGVFQERIQTVLDTANFHELEDAAILARYTRDGKVDPDLDCTIDTSNFTYGGNNLVLKVSFSDNVHWIARIQLNSMDEEMARENKKTMISEVATMVTVRKNTTIPVPQVFAYYPDPSNAFGYPYMLMELLPGRVLQNSIVAAVPPEYLPKVAKQLAAVMHQLQRFECKVIGYLWCGENGDEPVTVIPERPNETSTSLGWCYAQRQLENRMAMRANRDDPEWNTACWILKTAVPHFILEDRVNGPFPLCHIDLYGNLLFDDDYNLTGVIDWSDAQTLPLERLAVCAEFITAPAAGELLNNRTLALRDLVREHLEDLEAAEEFSSDDTTRTRLSDFFATKQADIAYRCTDSSPRYALEDAKVVAELIYGDAVTWEQLVRVYGEQELDY